MTDQVYDASERQRFEIVRDGEVLGHAEYRTTDQRIIFTHTEINPAYEGQGLGSHLVRSALDQVRDSGLTVVPRCPFVAEWMSHHPEYADLDYRHPANNADN